ncbi:MAG: hypothetical protein L6Q99_07845 [Planctomycetes bacterium]|nr:hypothetical protein [Planctomycetota bacterium]
MSQPTDARTAAAPATLFVLLVACAAALRFFRLGEWGLWIDEAFTLTDVHAAVAGREGWPANPLGYRLVGWWTAWTRNESEFALRFVPALFGAAALPLVAWALRPLAGRRTAWLAALLLGANTWALYWTQNARFYSIALAFGALGLGCFARALFTAATARAALVWLGGAFASFALAALAHPSALLFAGAVAFAPLVLFVLRVRPSRTFGVVVATLLALALAGALLSMPWATELWRKYQENKASPSPLHFVLTTGYHVTPWLALAAVFGLLEARRARAAAPLWLAVALVTTLLAVLGLSLFARVSAQYVFVALPAFAWLAAHALESLAARRAAWGRAALAGMLLLGCADQTHYFFGRNGDRERWREAYQFVWNSRGPNDLIVGMAGPVGEYYLAPDSSSFRQPLALVPLTTHNAFVTVQWARRDRRVWYVVLDEWLAEWPRNDRNRLLAYLDESGTLMAEFPVDHPIRDLTVRVWLVD